MKNADDFRECYDKYLEAVNEKYIIKTRKDFLVCLIMGINIIGISILLYVLLDSILYFLCLFMIFALIIAFKNKCEELKYEHKYVVSSIIVKFLSNNKNAGVKERVMVSRKAIRECELFNTNELEIFGDNYTLMSEGRFNIILSDILLLYYTNRGTTKEIFNGVYFSATFNKPIREQIYAIPNNIKDVYVNKFMNYFEYAGVRVLLENNEFEKRYNVYSIDELQARYIITLRLMERINDIDKLFPGKKYIVFKKTGKISILFSEESIGNMLNKKISLFSRNSTKEFCEEIFNYFNKYIEVYKILDLDNKLYMFGA